MPKEGEDTFQGTDSFGLPLPNILRRQLPMVEPNETFPLPYFDVRVTVWHKCQKTNFIAVEGQAFYHRVYIPQVIVVRFSDDGRLKFLVPVMSKLFPNEVAIAKNNPDLIGTVDDICAHLLARFAGVNMRVVNRHAQGFQIRGRINNLKGNVKTVWLDSPFNHKNPTAVGYARGDDMTEGNQKRYGSCDVGVDRLEDLLVTLYDEQRTNNIPAAQAQYNQTHLKSLMYTPAIHEPCHLMGLVSIAYSNGRPDEPDQHPFITHNRPEIDLISGQERIYIMNSKFIVRNAVNGAHPNFKDGNKKYLEFILPLPKPQP
jgi:hypothetical protein